MTAHINGFRRTAAEVLYKEDIHSFPIIEMVNPLMDGSRFFLTFWLIPSKKLQ